MLVRNSGSQKLTVTRNQQWSVSALADNANGTVLERYTYGEFGKRTILDPNGTTVRSSSNYNNPYGYTSRRHDEESGLMYFRARYYDNQTGEFISRDPLEFVDGMSLYRGYFAVRGTDANGLKCNRECKIIRWDFVSVHPPEGRHYPDEDRYEARFRNFITFDQNSDCSCCEYRQYIQYDKFEITLISPDGVESDLFVLLCDPLRPHEFHPHVLGGIGGETCSFPGEFTEDVGRNGERYGYRGDEEKSNDIYYTNDRPNGCQYKMHDTPGFSINSIVNGARKLYGDNLQGYKIRFEMDLQFLMNVVDVCNGGVKASKLHRLPFPPFEINL